MGLTGGISGVSARARGGRDRFDPASGLVSTERLAPVSEAQVDEWTAKIDAALERT